MIMRSAFLRQAFDSFSLLRRPFIRSIKTNVADLRKGDWLDYDSKVLIVQSVTSAHSGRGARHFLITTKEALSNQVVLIKPNPRDDFEKMEMHDSACQFMYQNGDELVLMDSKTFEEYCVPAKLMDPNLAKVLESGTIVKYRQSEGRPIMISSGPTVKCTVTEVADARETSDMKKKTCVAVTQGGARVLCSVQVQAGDAILVNLEDLSYNSRA